MSQSHTFLVSVSCKKWRTQALLPVPLRLESHIGAQPAAQALLPVPLHLESNIGAQPRVAVLQTPVGSASAGSNFSELVFFRKPARSARILFPTAVPQKACKTKGS